MAVSFPHFYGGDPSLVNNVNGIHPDPEKHQSVVGVQPVIKKNIILISTIIFQIKKIKNKKNCDSRRKKFDYIFSLANLN